MPLFSIKHLFKHIFKCTTSLSGLAQKPKNSIFNFGNILYPHSVKKLSCCAKTCTIEKNSMMVPIFSSKFVLNAGPSKTILFSIKHQMHNKSEGSRARANKLDFSIRQRFFNRKKAALLNLIRPVWKPNFPRFRFFSSKCALNATVLPKRFCFRSSIYYDTLSHTQQVSGFLRKSQQIRLLSSATFLPSKKLHLLSC